MVRQQSYLFSSANLNFLLLFFPSKLANLKVSVYKVVTPQRSDPTVAWIEAIIRFVNVLSASRQHKLSASSAGLRSTFIGVLCIRKKTFNLLFSR